MRYIGIDPGTSGGICVIGNEVRVWPMPDSPAELWYLFADMEGDGDVTAMIEHVHSGSFAGRTQGVKSAFTFGQNYGRLEVALIAAGIPFERVTPRKWQAEFGLLRKNAETDVAKKNRHKARAQELCPAIRMTHAVADAFLIAEFCRRTRT